jgi:hypothetical protein
MQTEFICGFRSVDPKDSQYHSVFITRKIYGGTYTVVIRQNGDIAAYTTTQFLVTAISTMTLLMAESGIGHSWEPINTQE